MAEEQTTQQRVEEIFAPEEAPEEINEPEPVEEEPEEESTEEPEEEPAEEPAEEAPEELVEFEFEGELLEATPKIRDALMRTQDYTQKTQEVAAQRKEIEVRLGQIEEARKRFEFAESVQNDILAIQNKQSEAKQYQEYLTQYINSDNFSTQVVEQIREKIRETNEEVQSLGGEVTRKQQEFQQASKQALEELGKKGTEVLKAKIPNWNEKAQAELRDYALTEGYTPEEIQAMYDPRMALTLWKASRYDSLQNGKAAAVKQVQSAPSIKQKARSPMPENVKRKLNLRKELNNPKLSDKEKARKIRKELGERFG